MSAIVIGGQDLWGSGVAVGAWHTGVLGSDIATGGFDGGSPLDGMTGLEPASRYTAWIISAPAGVAGVWDITNAALALTADEPGIYTIEIGVAEDGADIGTADILWYAGVEGGNVANIALQNDGVSAAGTVAITADLSVTLDGDTLAAAGGVAIDGAASITAADDTASGGASVGIQGEAAITSGNDTLAADGTVGTPDITGDAAINLGNDTGSATGDVAISGAVDTTLQHDTATIAGAVDIQGGAAITLGNDTLLASDSANTLLTINPERHIVARRRTRRLRA